ncbi:hypothetical protein BBJ28_00006674 [Nothophytophthora sp. Chile5]|nr:hypothetical protein BBJ28_00006674 [Nothophytophthora sp. Chile5]
MTPIQKTNRKLMSTVTTTKESDWRAEYAKVAALRDVDEVAPTATAQQTPNAPVDGVLGFLDCMLSEEGGDWWATVQSVKSAAADTGDKQANQTEANEKEQLKAAKKRLAVAGGALVVALPELNASVNGKQISRDAKVRVLQLQLVCRMLRYGTLAKKKKDARKAARKEIRGLLDRVALLLDAANPPSLADEDADERSPFQHFLQRELAPRLHKLLPDLAHYLLKTYELEDDQSGDGDQSKPNDENALSDGLFSPVKGTEHDRFLIFAGAAAIDEC